LNNRQHTSNMLKDLQRYAPEYSGAAHYVDAPAVSDRHVITASGLAPVDFARAIFAELGVLNVAQQAMWYNMFKHGRIPGPRAAEPPSA
jgi:hypothetical protein